MKHFFCAATLGLLFLSFTPLPLGAADNAAEEQRLIAILGSKGSPQEKDTACVRLKLIGTAASVPALAALLADEHLSVSARYALEPMAAPEAGRALLGALETSSGSLKVGIINSLGNRREVEAIKALAQSLQDPDADLAAAAASALGKIGRPEAAKALRAAWPGSNAAMHSALVAGLLRAADQLLAAGDNVAAETIFEQLYQGREKEIVRTSAYAGMIRSAGQRGLRMAINGIQGNEPAAQAASLLLARDIQDPTATKALADLLPKSSAAVQIALVGVLVQREDSTAAPALAALLKSDAPEVRAAALGALGTLGDAYIIPLLAQSAASGNASEQSAARQSLLQLHQGKVTEVLLAQLAEAAPPIKAEVARALGERRETAAVPKLAELAEKGTDSSRKSALQALALLIEPSQLDSLVKLVASAQTDVARADAAQALNSAFQRIKSKEGRVDAGPLVKALDSGSPQVRVALLPVCSGLTDVKVRAALRGAIGDSDTQVRTAGIRALCDTIDPELLPDLVKLACAAPEENLRTLAIGGCVRLTTQEEGVKLSNAQRVETLKPILATTLTIEQKRLVLSGLSEIPDAEALKLVEPLVEDAAVHAEAAQAAIKIAPALPDSEAATRVLKKVLAANPDAATRSAAEAALKQIDARGGFITAWQVAGPYRQANKDYSALFDIAFPAESPGNRGVKWELLPVCTDPARPWSMDLLKALGGEQCVAYARTWIYSPQQQPVRLEIGSDDGVKVWLNTKLVHANNVARPLQPGQDKLDVTLNQGWNPILLKVTQNNLGWEFCVRALRPDGSRPDGLRVDAARE